MMGAALWKHTTTVSCIGGRLLFTEQIRQRKMGADKPEVPKMHRNHEAKVREVQQRGTTSGVSVIISSLYSINIPGVQVLCVAC